MKQCTKKKKEQEGEYASRISGEFMNNRPSFSLRKSSKTQNNIQQDQWRRRRTRKGKIRKIFRKKGTHLPHPINSISPDGRF